MAKIPVVFTFDKRIILGASVAIKSLIESANKDTIYDIKILHSDLSLKNQANISKLVSNTKHSISFYYIDKNIFKGLKKSKGSWTEIVYYRLLIPEIIFDEKVIYSDVDVYFKKDLTEIYETEIGNNEIIAVRAEINSPEAKGHKYFKENKNDFIYWSGFMVMNCKKLKEEKYFEKFMNTAREFKDKLRFYDLDVLNLTCKNIKSASLQYCILEPIFEFDDYTKMRNYEYLSKFYTKQDFELAKNCPIIIHYAGELGKPWRRKNPPEYYKETIKRLPKELVKYTFRDIRKKFFSKG